MPRFEDSYFYDFEVDGSNLVRRGWKVTGYGGISSEFWGHILRHAKRRGIPVSLTAKDAWTIYIEQGGCCALTGAPIWFSPGEDVGGARWMADVLARLASHPETFDPDGPMLREKANEVTASLDRIESARGYSDGNVQWIHKRIQSMKMGSSEEEFIYFCERVARFQKTRTF